MITTSRAHPKLRPRILAPGSLSRRPSCHTTPGTVYFLLVARVSLQCRRVYLVRGGHSAPDAAQTSSTPLLFCDVCARDTSVTRSKQHIILCVPLKVKFRRAKILTLFPRLLEVLSLALMVSRFAASLALKSPTETELPDPMMASYSSVEARAIWRAPPACWAGAKAAAEPAKRTRAAARRMILYSGLVGSKLQDRGGTVGVARRVEGNCKRWRGWRGCVSPRCASVARWAILDS